MGTEEPPERGVRILGTSEEALVPNLLPAELARWENLDEPAHVHEKVRGRISPLPAATTTTPHAHGPAATAPAPQFCAYSEVLLHEMCATVEELAGWKEEMLALQTLPTNVVTGLLSILGQLLRWSVPWGGARRRRSRLPSPLLPSRALAPTASACSKSRLRGAVLQLANLVRSYVRDLLRDEELNRLKLQLTRRAWSVPAPWPGSPAFWGQCTPVRTRIASAAQPHPDGPRPHPTRSTRHSPSWRPAAKSPWSRAGRRRPAASCGRPLRSCTTYSRRRAWTGGSVFWPSCGTVRTACRTSARYGGCRRT